jgi:hypothetical protein
MLIVIQTRYRKRTVEALKIMQQPTISPNA